MSRTPARFTQADVARSIRAAKQADAAGVELRRDGSIFIHLTPQSPQEQDDEPLAKSQEIVL
jgi:hypothetical protein